MAESTRTFKRLGEGTYTCFLNRITTGTTKSGKPRTSFAFKVCDGEDKGEFVWDNVTCDTEIGMAVLVKKFNALVPDLGVPAIAPGDMASVETVAKIVTDAAGSRRFKVRVTKNDKGFDKVYAEVL